ncbi:MAG: hypothetical protein DSM107014_06365 [Gomphosphaeria aponina SAG 52.96 = DSM 107014]|uniref:Uncharacterized protein n=1 Tax=Gomphosphaeria aponina SAG 52.96 = DSM 107014 TaxID=1521640 RepID=A0A941GR08_9CHRO|nr:hypothetical protein [Gomphosphaeria aponina SAG 52.96 = DSM 107014]
MFTISVASVTLPDDSPGAKIKASIDKLNAAINDIQNLRQLLNSIAEVISAVNDLIGPIAKRGIVLTLSKSKT